MNKNPLDLIIRKYSKSSAFYFDTKDSFFSDNARHLKKALSQNASYASQSARLQCKLCCASLIGEADITSHGVKYRFCDTCTHLNGLYTDTDEFTRGLYFEDAGKGYASNYLDERYHLRVENIYRPKIDFYVDHTNDPVHSLLDVGCGGGHFVCAALEKGLDASGVDINKTLINFGNTQIRQKLGCSPLNLVNEEEISNCIRNSNADVISANAIFEHLRDPKSFFDAFRQSNAKLIYYSVPMYSMSVILENVFKDVFPRHLSGGHTHLFTERSLKKLNELLGVEPIAEWRFGTDILDLYRSLMVTARNNGTSERCLETLASSLKSIVDELQATFDKNHYCSQIHCVARKI